MASSLPNPRLRPAFRRSDNEEVPRNEDGFPCEVPDYVLDSQKWINDIARPGQRTVRGVLEDQNRHWDRNCFTCEQNWSDCPKATCVRVFHSLRRRPEYQEKFEIRPTSNMGLGVFAGRHILEGEILDEYFGELIPKRLAAQRDDDDYIFEIGNVASSSAKEYGNWTRFINHRCDGYNLEATDDVLGGRRTITFRALRNIPPGTQLFINYGSMYFGDGENYILCRCPDYKGSHLPPKQKGQKRKDQEAFPRTGKEKRQKTNIPPDISIPDKNSWIDKKKAWLKRQAPNGYPHWTMLHWRLLEQLVRRRRTKNPDWRDRSEFWLDSRNRRDKRLKMPVSTETAQMTIKKWHLDVITAFQKDEVCGRKQGELWETDDLLKRIFALVVAARRRKRRMGKRGRSPSTTQAPATPAKSESSGTSSGGTTSPPRPMLQVNYPDAQGNLPKHPNTVDTGGGFRIGF